MNRDLNTVELSSGGEKIREPPKIVKFYIVINIPRYVAEAKRNIPRFSECEWGNSNSWNSLLFINYLLNKIDLLYQVKQTRDVALDIANEVIDSIKIICSNVAAFCPNVQGNWVRRQLKQPVVYHMSRQRRERARRMTEERNKRVGRPSRATLGEQRLISNIIMAMISEVRFEPP